jgi:hypothetical protein
MNSYIEKKIQLFIKYMIEFQKNNNIKGQCITNTQYLYDHINHNFSNIKHKAKAVICVTNNNNIITCIVHMVIIIDNNIYDPSYEIISLNNLSYYDNIKTIISVLPHVSKEMISKTFTGFIKFIELADKINKGGLLVCDKDFYNNQADYVEIKNKKLIMNILSKF